MAVQEENIEAVIHIADIQINVLQLLVNINVKNRVYIQVL